MKLATSLSLVAGLVVATAPASAVEYTVSRCADLADVDNNLATVLTIDSNTFVCDEYTRFRVRNAMTLKATGPAVEFSNFSLKILGELTVEPDVVFTGVVDQVCTRWDSCADSASFKVRVASFYSFFHKEEMERRSRR